MGRSTITVRWKPRSRTSRSRPSRSSWPSPSTRSRAPTISQRPDPTAVRFRRLSPEVAVIRQRSFTGLTVGFYALSGRHGLALVDAGFPNRADDVEEGLRGLGFELSELRRVLYTHTHIDHMGGGPALCSRPDVSAEHVIWHRSAFVADDWLAHLRRSERWGSWLAEIVTDPELTAKLLQRREQHRARRRGQRSGPTLIEPVRAAQPSERVAAGAFRLEPVEAPGHDPYHVVWYDRDARVAFTGDVVLPVPTPVSRVMGDDLATYLATLDRLTSLDIEVAYPGHGAPFRNVAQRLAQSRRFVTDRLAAIESALADEGSLTLLELAVATGGEAATHAAHLPLVLANVDSSVHYLAAEGRVTLNEGRVELARRAETGCSVEHI